LTLIEFIESIVAGVIATLILEYFKNAVSTRAIRPHVVLQTQPCEEILPRYDHRSEGQERLDQVIWELVYRFLSFYFIYVSVAAPLVVKAAFFHGTLLLSDARFVGDFLPSVAIESRWIQGALFLIACVLYVPIAYGVRSMVSWVESRRRLESNFARRRFALIFYFCISAVIATLVVYIYYAVTILQAAMSVFMFSMLGAGAGTKKTD
jgi:hypothetical protein